MTVAMVIIEWLLVMAVTGWLIYRIPQVWRIWRAARAEELRQSRERERHPVAASSTSKSDHPSGTSPLAAL